MKKQTPFVSEIKKQASETFVSIKTKKTQTIEKLNIFANKLDRKAEFIESYFKSIVQFIER